MKLHISLIAIAMIGLRASASGQDLKQTQITPIINALPTVLQLNPITFSYDSIWGEKLKIRSGVQNGLNIEDLTRSAPQLIIDQKRNYTEGKNNNKTATLQKVDYEALIPLLVGSIKEQQLQIEQLKAEVRALKTKTSK